jgi:hypothetical protein
MTKVCVIGAKGNMGRRYMAILAHLGVEAVGVDVDDDDEPGQLKGITHYIVAVPTYRHVWVLRQLTSFYRPQNTDAGHRILCEKPVTKDRAELEYLERRVKRGHKIYMVNQYAYYSDQLPQKSGITCYDYYNSGKDGTHWDCIQLIHLARGEITTLTNKSPVWRCVINGTELNREAIDLCYVKMIRDFISDGREYGRLWGWDDIKASHEKVFRYYEDSCRGAGEER